MADTRSTLANRRPAAAPARQAGLRIGRELPTFSLAVGRRPAALDVEDPEEAPAPAPEQTATPAPIPPAALAASPGRLDVSQPGDPLEREADQAADRAVRRLTGSPGGAAGEIGRAHV